MKYTIAVDFDGVIHQYLNGWEGADVISSPPMPGAFEWLDEMVQHFDVVIFSARLTPDPDLEHDAQDKREGLDGWFLKHGMDADLCSKLRYWQDRGKPPALIYIDDRGFRFEGSFPSRDDIHRMKPWKHGGW